MMPLGLLSAGEKAEVAKVPPGTVVSPEDDKKTCPSQEKGKCKNQAGGSCHGKSRMEDMGIREGKTVEMLSNGGGGPILLTVDGARMAIGRGLAMRILVRRNTE